MKPSLFLQTALVVAALMSTFAAFAGGNVENGGDGVILTPGSNVIYSLDLVERGLQANAYISDPFPISPEVKSSAETFFHGLVSANTLSIVEKKLARMEVNYPNDLYQPIQQILKTYEFVFIDAPFRTIHDSDSPIANYVMVQLAAHSSDDRLVQINQQGFNEMDSLNQAALLLHELIYASTYDTTSRNSRQVNADLFDPTRSSDTLSERIDIAVARDDGGSQDYSLLANVPDLIPDFIKANQIAETSNDLASLAGWTLVADWGSWETSQSRSEGGMEEFFDDISYQGTLFGFSLVNKQFDLLSVNPSAGPAISSVPGALGTLSVNQGVISGHLKNGGTVAIYKVHSLGNYSYIVKLTNAVPNNYKNKAEFPSSGYFFLYDQHGN